MSLAALPLAIPQKIEYLRTLPAIRERCSRVHKLAQEGKLQYFDYHPDKEADAVDYCAKVIDVRAPLIVALFSAAYNISISQRKYGSNIGAVSLGTHRHIFAAVWTPQRSISLQVTFPDTPSWSVAAFGCGSTQSRATNP